MITQGSSFCQLEKSYFTDLPNKNTSSFLFEFNFQMCVWFHKLIQFFNSELTAGLLIYLK